MAYTVVSVFPVTVDTEEIKKGLKQKGFDEANIIISKSRVESGMSDQYQEDKQTQDFLTMFSLTMRKCWTLTASTV
ncbi:hypothetical protein OWR28_24555 [Chryseobacterium sp. 1B4]